MINKMAEIFPGFGVCQKESLLKNHGLPSATQLAEKLENAAT